MSVTAGAIVVALALGAAAAAPTDAETPAAAPAVSPSATPEPPAPGSRDALGFARSLHEEGDYYRAITEAKRFLFEHPEDARAPDARLLIGRSYLDGEQWTAAIAALEPLVAAGGAARVDADAALALGDARLGARQFAVAALEYSRFGREFPADARAGIADLRAGWARILGADEIARFDAKRGARAFDAAARELGRLPPDHSEAARVKELADGAASLAALPRRSPVLAGTLSALLPGAGQVYAGRVQDGLIALVVNGLFLGGAIESYRRENYVASAILGLFELGWYTGNVYSAVNAAHRGNDERRAAAIRKLRKRLWVGLAPAPGGGALAAWGGTFP